MELATRDIMDIQPYMTGSQPIQHIQQQPSRSKQHHKSHACYRCGSVDHYQRDCRFKNAMCHGCGKLGHISKVCRSKPKERDKERPQPSSKKVQKLNTAPADTAKQTDERQLETEDYTLFHLGGGTQPIQVNVTVNKRNLPMELDTGLPSQSSVTRRPYRCWIYRKHPLRLKQHCVVVGYIDVEVCYESTTAVLPLFIMKGKCPSLLARNWLARNPRCSDWYK